MRAFLVSIAPALAVPGQSPFAAQHERIERLCVDCHGGDTTKGKLDLRALSTADTVVWLTTVSRMRDRVRAAEMPPADAEQPTAAERADLLAWCEATLRAGVPGLPVTPGRTTIRRLSRVEWENSIRDLFGVRSAAIAAFPADDLGYGFDNIGDALSFSTLHLEKYLAAAADVAAQVFDGEDPAHPTVRRFEAEAMTLVDGPGASLDGDVAGLYTNSAVGQPVTLPRDGRYRLRILVGADQAGDEPAKMLLRIDGRDLDSMAIGERKPAVQEREFEFAGGRHRLDLAFTNDFWDPKNPDERRRDRNLRIDWVEVVGPIDVRTVPAAQQWLHAALPKHGTVAARARALARALLLRVWRRPPGDDETARLARLVVDAVAAGEPLTQGLRLLLTAALASPHFLFRGEPGGTDGKAGVAPLSGFALASRLSFFLWSSAPDPTLLELAGNGTLTGAVLREQALRLLVDPRSDALATNFAAQWLELRALPERTPDPARYPGFDDGLRTSFRRQTELLFLTVLRENRDVRELLDADFTHVDARLAEFYGLPAPPGDGFERVALASDQRLRGGVLGHGSVLAVTSNPTRTSPVKRGKWILDNLLGQAPPAPPPGNDTLAGEAQIDSAKTFREQLAQHRAKPECAGCHVRMDTLGFALENFDAVGRYRVADAGGVIDASGALPDGRQIRGLAELQAVLRDDPAFVRTLLRKLFVYGVGRDVAPIDRLVLDQRADELLANGKVTLPDLLLVVVHSEPFLRRSVGR
ncbi:MAG: DUF1592 domain-containing protein [Planctomycetes bacterium]|nr:DUF1592 domain-containing protein [Planctomycetota bacterium]